MVKRCLVRLSHGAVSRFQVHIPGDVTVLPGYMTSSPGYMT